MATPAPAQQIKFCQAPDGVRIAYAVSGTGPPMLVSTCWLSHLQHDWESPVWRHFLGDAVTPLDLKQVSSNVFTAPEIATVGWQQKAIDEGEIPAETVRLDLAGNPRAKMQGVHDGFVKLFCRPGTGIIVGGVVVGPRASELVHPISIAVAESLTVDQMAHAFTVYPSMSGSIAEAARRLHHSHLTAVSQENKPAK